MKKIIFTLFLTTLFYSCTHLLLNKAFTKIGVYDDVIKIEKLANNKKEIIFFPMHHVGTRLFYDDVKNKIDSLNKIGYHFYFESVKSSDENYQKKLDLMLGLNNVGNDYLKTIDSLFLANNVKPKKKLLNQPKPIDFKIDQSKYSIVDLSVKEIVDEYERNNGVVLKQDFDWAKKNKKDKIELKKKINNTVLGYRNINLLDFLRKDNDHNKIAIIYGKEHFIGIRAELLKLGYVASK